MSGSNYYKEKDGGARLGAIRQGSTEGFAGRKNETSATELRSVGGAHPGTEQRAVGGCLMLGMVSGMLGRLGLRQTADGQHAQHQHNRDEFTDWGVHL
jgi:hypothetical protein